MKVLRSEFEDAELRQWWENAYREGRLVRNTFFQSPAWNRAWYEHFIRDDDRSELLLLKIMHGDVVVAVAPLFLQHRRVAGMTAWKHAQFLAAPLAQYTDLVTTEESPGPVWQALLAFLREKHSGSWLQLHDVLDASTVRGTDVQPDECSPGEPYLRIPLGSWNDDALLARCSSHMRREIQRARRRMQESETLRWTAVSAPEPELVDTLIALNRSRFGDVSWFADARARDFFREVCVKGGKEVLFSVLQREERIIHVMCSYLHGGECMYVLSGMDEEARALSPGTMNIDLTIRHAALRGTRHFDFLRGDEAYKREFFPEERRSEHWVLHPGGSGAVRHRMAQTVRRVAGRSDPEGGKT